MSTSPKPEVVVAEADEPTDNVARDASSTTDTKINDNRIASSPEPTKNGDVKEASAPPTVVNELAKEGNTVEQPDQPKVNGDSDPMADYDEFDDNEGLSDIATPSDVQDDVLSEATPDANGAEIIVNAEEVEAKSLPVHDDEDQHLNKRRRTQQPDYGNDTEEQLDGYDNQSRLAPPPKIQRGLRVPDGETSHGLGGAKSVIVGYWRDSDLTEPADKHRVIGFVDTLGRLRTKVDTRTRDGRDIGPEHPVPVATWAQFETIIFDRHLKHLDKLGIKEYVQIRVNMKKGPETEQEKAENDRKAAVEAVDRLHRISRGEALDDPADATAGLKRRRTTNDIDGVDAGNSPRRFTPANSNGDVTTPYDSGTTDARRPNVLLGYWTESIEPLLEDKHAVYGVLGQSGYFRVKLVNKTRDNRPLGGEFPKGPGAIWLPHSKVVFEPHLASLGKNGLKDYTRLRQKQIGLGETVEDRTKNELEAAEEAKRLNPEEPASNPHQLNGGHYSPDAAARRAARRSMNNLVVPRSPGAPPQRRERHSMPGQAQGQPERKSSVRRQDNLTHELVVRELQRAEAAQARHLQQNGIQDPGMLPPSRPSQQHNQHLHHRAVSTTPAPAPGMNGAFANSVESLNRVWAIQEGNLARDGGTLNDTKVHMGVKYERKTSGPFEGKHVSSGAIISIDGEDYVEYRVLTKPSFF